MVDTFMTIPPEAMAELGTQLKGPIVISKVRLTRLIGIDTLESTLRFEYVASI
jgi:hypothetical protein